MAYLWTKVFHLLMVISWFAGLFYLPRIYVNMAQASDPASLQTLTGMAERLLRFMKPLAVLTLVTGFSLYLIFDIGKGALWLHLKLLLVAALVIYHWYCARLLARFKAGQNQRSHVYYRWFNEIPVLLLLLVLILVLIKPF